MTAMAGTKHLPVRILETYGWQGKEGDSQQSKASSEEPSLPGTGGLVAIANSG